MYIGYGIYGAFVAALCERQRRFSIANLEREDELI